MNKINLDDYTIQSLVDFGKGVGTEVALASSYDGLKVSYRRIIYTVLGLPDKLTKTAAISGTCLSKYHPHSSDALDQVIAALVRYGILEGQGNFGMKMIYGDDIQPSASRYTEARLDPKWRKLLSFLMPYVPYKEAELEGNMEPEYLPTPIPLILLFNGLGISYGANARYPMFTAKSIFNAMIYDDPYQLEAAGDLILDKDNSELNELWTKGLGRLTYKYQVEKAGLPSGYGTMIKGSAEIFKPNLDKVFEEELEKGQVYILDHTSGEIPEIFVGRSPNVRAVSLDDIQATCEYACTYTRMFRLTVTDGKQCYCIPLREWLRETYTNYLNLIEVYKKDKISKLEFDYKVYDWLPLVTQCLIDNRDYTAEDIVKAMNNPECDLEVVSAILRKSISTLRNIDSTSKLKSIQDQIKEFKKLDPEKYVYDIINEF